jgi:hypothetical protein
MQYVPQVGEEFVNHFVQPVINGWPMVAASFAFWLGLQLSLDYIFPTACPALYAKIRASSKKDSWANIRTRVMGKVLETNACCGKHSAL